MPRADARDGRKATIIEIRCKFLLPRRYCTTYCSRPIARPCLHSHTHQPFCPRTTLCGDSSKSPRPASLHHIHSPPPEMMELVSYLYSISILRVPSPLDINENKDPLLFSFSCGPCSGWASSVFRSRHT